MAEEKFGVREGLMAFAGLAMLIGLGARLSGCAEENGRAQNAAEEQGEVAAINDVPPPAQQEVAPQNDGYEGSDWIKREQVDPMTDEKSVYFLLGYSPRIMVVCLGGGSVGLSLDVEGLLGRTNFPKLRQMVGDQATYAPINMLVRLDDAKPSSQEWSLHLSKEFIKPQGDGVEFFKSLRGHERLVIRPDQLGNYSYDIKGADSVYEEMAAACKS